MNFTELWHSHYGILYFWVLRHTRNREHAEDIASLAMEKAFASFNKLRDPKRFTKWLYTIARHLLISSRRNVPVMVSLDDPDAWEGRELRAPESRRLERISEVEYFVRQVAQLPAPMRDVIALATEGLRYREIARRLNIPEMTVGSRLTAARKRLLEGVDHV